MRVAVGFNSRKRNADHASKSRSDVLPTVDQGNQDILPGRTLMGLGDLLWMARLAG